MVWVPRDLHSTLYHCPVVVSFGSFVFDWLWILSVSLQFLFNHLLSLLIAILTLKSSLTKLPSPLQNSRDKSLCLRKLTGFVPFLTIWSHSLLSCLLISSSLSLMLSWIVPLDSTAPFGRPSASFEFLYSLSLYPFCPRHNSLWRSLFMRVLSHSTLTASMGIWHSAGVTKWVTSPAAHRVYGIVRVLVDLDCTLVRQEVFCPDKKVTRKTKISM